MSFPDPQVITSDEPAKQVVTQNNMKSYLLNPKEDGWIQTSRNQGSSS